MQARDSCDLCLRVMKRENDVPQSPETAPRSGARDVSVIRRDILLRAAARAQVDVVRLVIDAGVDLAACDSHGWTALHFACQVYAVDVCRLLLDAGAPVDAQDALGITPLHRAILEAQGRGEVIALLRAHGANPHCPNHGGVTPLLLARRSGATGVARFFADLL